MRVVRLLFATALVFAALCVVVGQIMLWSEDDPDEEPMHPLQHVEVSVGAICLLFTAYYYSRPRSHWESQLRCPHCHETRALTLSALRRPRVSVGAHVVGGFVGSLLHSLAQKRAYVCGSCHTPSDLRTVGGWVALTWGLFVVLSIAVELYVSETT